MSRYKVNPFTDLRKWQNLDNRLQNLINEKSDTIDYLGFGKIVVDKIAKFDSAKRGATMDISIDLSPALEEDKRTGQVAVIIVPTQKA